MDLSRRSFLFGVGALFASFAHASPVRASRSGSFKSVIVPCSGRNAGFYYFRTSDRSKGFVKGESPSNAHAVIRVDDSRLLLVNQDKNESWLFSEDGFVFAGKITAPPGYVFRGHAIVYDDRIHLTADHVDPRQQIIHYPSHGQLSGAILTYDTKTLEYIEAISTEGNKPHDIKVHEGHFVVANYGVANDKAKADESIQKFGVGDYYAQKQDGRYRMQSHANVALINVKNKSISKVYDLGVEYGACAHFGVSQGHILAGYLDQVYVESLRPIAKRVALDMGAGVTPEMMLKAEAMDNERIKAFMDVNGITFMDSEIGGQNGMFMPFLPNAIIDMTKGAIHLTDPSTKQFRRSQSIAADPVSGQIFSTQAGTSNLFVYEPTTQKIKDVSTGSWGVKEPRAIAFDGEGHGVVIDRKGLMVFFNTNTLKPYDESLIDAQNAVHCSWV